MGLQLSHVIDQVIYKAFHLGDFLMELVVNCLMLDFDGLHGLAVEFLHYLVVIIPVDLQLFPDINHSII